MIFKRFQQLPAACRTKMKGNRVLVFVFLEKVIMYTPFFGKYLQDQKQFSSADIVLMFSIYSIGVIILEIPLGFLGDRFGVKKVLIIGAASIFISTLLFIIVMLL